MIFISEPLQLLSHWGNNRAITAFSLGYTFQNVEKWNVENVKKTRQKKKEVKQDLQAQ